MAANVGESTSGGTSGDAAGGSFECNICFELPQEPVVTLCGHLFCWPCLYRWLHMHAHTPKCPVYKAIVEEDKLVPLYGRGKDRVDPRSRNMLGADIPHRPAGQRPATAQQVLSDADKRSLYDQHGEGLQGPSTQQPGGGADDIFAEFFGSSPFTYSTTTRPKQQTAWDPAATMPPPPPVETKLACTLEELYTGVTKKMKISRNVVEANGRMITESEILSIEVKPGWKKGTKITFPGKGNQQRNQLPADLVFVVDEKPHEVYHRDGNDLVTEAQLTLAEALGGTIIVLVTLDGRELAVDLGGGEDEDAPVVCPGFELVVPMEGMPIAREPGWFGNLRIRFDIVFPERLTRRQRFQLKRVLEAAGD